MGGREKSAVAATVNARLKREDYGRTKHDAAFSDWKMLIGPSDSEDHSMGKEGAARYRVHNLPTSSNPGLYELGAALSSTKSGREIRKFDPSYVIVVYVGQADCVRTRLQQYGRSGAHLGNCSSIARGDDSQSSYPNKQTGLFGEVLSRGYSIVFRWAPMNNKGDALKTEALLLDTFDYAWNKGSNGARRSNDILQKLREASSTAHRVSRITEKLLPFLQKKVGIEIRGKLPSLHTERADSSEENNFFHKIFKFSRSNPRAVLERHRSDEDETGLCGIYLCDGNICKRPPVKGRKRCAEHKGMRINVRLHSQALNRQDMTDHGLTEVMLKTEKVQSDSDNLPASESFSPVVCGFILGDGSSCKELPVSGRKRCSEHKGRRIATLSFESSRSQQMSYAHNTGQNTSETYDVGKLEVRFLPEKCDMGTAVCGVDFGDGTFCTRQPVKGRVRCKDHKGMRVSRTNKYVVS